MFNFAIGFDVDLPILYFIATFCFQDGAGKAYANSEYNFNYTWIACGTVVAITVLAYDWALTLDMEINLVWKKKWNVIKGIYLFQRYIVIFDSIAQFYRQVGSEMTDTKCNRLKAPVMDFPAPPYEGYRGCFPLRGSPYIIWWWAALLTRCLHSMLASRALLQMRQQLQRPATATDLFPSAVQFEINAETIALSEATRQPRNSDRITTETP
ncbi:hypothetical protein CVT25_002548 [Psilocybe cyanescens]|uniref:DUF6533 domain-containing protein n=1 Tax=Psilocybe cyanescens TaxID=93625 RepID=A0A409XUT2_PSICY|nr:hypothetical protein CVT25_002548 [Psilocybe cyanescens]